MFTKWNILSFLFTMKKSKVFSGIYRETSIAHTYWLKNDLVYPHIHLTVSDHLHNCWLISTYIGDVPFGVVLQIH